MATYELTERIKFMLPPGFVFSRDKSDDGDEVISILADEYNDDDGETCYKFNCRIIYIMYNPQDPDKAVKSENLLDFLAESMNAHRQMKLPGMPRAVLLSRAMPLSILGCIIKTYATIGIIQVSDRDFIQLIVTGEFNDDDPSENTKRYENLLEVLKATRIDGNALQLGGLSASEVEDALQLEFDENCEATDISPKIHFSFSDDDETTTYECTADSIKEAGKEYLTRVVPDEELYPHYDSVRSAGSPGFPGVKIVVNASGAEYHFIPLRDVAEDYRTEEEIKALYNRVIAKDTENYDLNKKAKVMQKLFHVNETVFDPHHDRECELEEGLMHRAYMMSGLRSFAWTLADYCKQHDCSPEDIDNTAASRIANFVASQDWLNYDGETYCQGLCSGSDLHVYFVPDGTSQADKQKLLPSKEDLDRVKHMKEIFPNYREILCEVHSLNALRKDLKYIYPAVKALWDNLKEERDYDKALLGNEADIVYAWCALALAAKEPFFSEDGPMNCFFSQPVDEAAQKARWETDEAEHVDEATEEWMRKYGKYLEKDPVIDFNGTLFVFSGLIGHWAEKDHPTVQKVIEKGGQYRSKVSGLTNYLVVNPGHAGQSKIVAATEQLKKGKNIKLILLEDLEKALEGKLATKQVASAAVEEAPTTSSTSTTPPNGTKLSRSDCEIDFRNTLTSYNGSAKAIILPDGVSTIGEDAFLDNNNITSVVIPEGVENIENGAFWMCSNLRSVILPSSIRRIGKNVFNSTALSNIIIPNGCEEIGADCFTNCKDLKDIYVPPSVTNIGSDAFYTFNEATVIHTQKGSAAERLAKENNWNVDYKPIPLASQVSTKPHQLDSDESSYSIDNLRAQISVTSDSSGFCDVPKSMDANKITETSQNTKKEGCYIATAVYGSYDAPEVLVLRRFRDEILSKYSLGRQFICLYYRLSPSIAERLKKAKHINRLVRFILDKIVNKITVLK